MAKLMTIIRLRYCAECGGQFKSDNAGLLYQLQRSCGCGPRIFCSAQHRADFKAAIDAGDEPECLPGGCIK